MKIKKVGIQYRRRCGGWVCEDGKHITILYNAMAMEESLPRIRTMQVEYDRLIYDAPVCCA